jgi:hypothetical protein
MGRASPWAPGVRFSSASDSPMREEPNENGSPRFLHRQPAAGSDSMKALPHVLALFAGIMFFCDCSLFKPYYGEAGLAFGLVSVADSGTGCSKVLSPADSTHICDLLFGKASGINRVWAGMYERPPWGMSRPDTGRIVVAFVVRPGEDTAAVALVENTQKYQPIQDRLIRMLHSVNYRRLGFDECKTFAFCFKFSLDLSKEPKAGGPDSPRAK